MGFDAENAQDAADRDSVRVLVDQYGRRNSNADQFDVAEAVTEDPAEYYKRILSELRDEAARPDARRGRYYLPNPDTGKTSSWQRMTNFVKLTDDTYHLDLWKQRNIVKGIALMIESGRVDASDLAGLDVKADKERLNNIVSAAFDEADTYAMATEGTLLHAATEVVDYTGGNLDLVLPAHRAKMVLYMDALVANGLTVLPDLIERVTVSRPYGAAGKFDRIYREADGSYVLSDLKTGDSLDLSFPSISAQLEGYEDGINGIGIFDGQRYDTSVKIRTDYALVVHLPSTRDEVDVYRVELDKGRVINAANLAVKDVRKIKAQHVASVYQPVLTYGVSPEDLDAYWLERLNAAQNYGELVSVAERAKSFDQWNARLAGQARLLAAELAVI